jgi:hypothetical protein
MNADRPGGPAAAVRALSSYGLSWIDVEPDLRKLRLGFIADQDWPRYVLDLAGVIRFSCSVQPEDELPYTIIDASLTARDGLYELHLEGDVVMDVVCRHCVVYAEER